METFKITTDETLRETMATIVIHLHTILIIFGNLTFIALTGIGIMN